MKKALKKLQNKASDEQKLFFASLASGSVALLLFLLWIASLGSVIPQKNNAKLEQNLESKQEKSNAEAKNEAAVLKSLSKNFFDLTEGEKEKAVKQEELKRQPFKLEI